MLLFVTLICGWLACCQSSESTGGRGGSVGTAIHTVEIKTSIHWKLNQNSKPKINHNKKMIVFFFVLNENPSIT